MALTIAMILLFQTTIGILGNFSLILHYIFLHFSGCRSKPTDLILTHLTVANSLAILCKGIPETMLAFGLTCHVNKVGCHSFSFLDRVGRGVSVCTTCLLSVFQVITINPLHSRWAGLKLKVFKYIGPCNIMNWILHMMVNAIFPIYASTKWINKTIAKENMSKCCTRNYDNVTFSLYVTFISFHDVLCLGFMSWASASVVFILYKHKQQVQHIYNHKITPRSSAETRATKSILVLVVTYVSFYAVSSIIYVYMAPAVPSIWWIRNASTFISMCFPTVSPFILLSSDPRVSRLCPTCYRTNICLSSSLVKRNSSISHRLSSRMTSSFTES